MQEESIIIQRYLQCVVPNYLWQHSKNEKEKKVWFKQAQLFQLTSKLSDSPDDLIEKLEKLKFKPCRPSMQFSMGWVSPIDEEDEPLVQTTHGRTMVCLQIEEKILPPIVIRQALAKKIKEIEKAESRKISQKEKYSLKDEITTTLLIRAFSKLTRVYAYMDTKNHWLVIGTINEKKIEQFLELFKKVIAGTGEVHPFELKKLSSAMTHWLKHKSYSSSFSIEKSCVLQDPNQTNRIIRCQQQDLFASSIQSLIKDGCEVKQLALTWHDHIDIVLSDNFALSRIRFHDEITAEASEMNAETVSQKFLVNFFVMTETFDGLFRSLLSELLGFQELKQRKTTSAIGKEKEPI